MAKQTTTKNRKAPVNGPLKQQLERLDDAVRERRIDTVEEAALLMMEAAELKRIGDREVNRAKRVLKGYDPGVYGDVEMWLEAANRQYLDTDAVLAFYAKHGEPVPYKPAQASIKVDFAGGRRSA